MVGVVTVSSFFAYYYVCDSSSSSFSASIYLVPPSLGAIHPLMRPIDGARLGVRRSPVVVLVVHVVGFMSEW